MFDKRIKKEVLTANEFIKKQNFIIDQIKGGAIFIYPTDTIYGIGCDAFNEESVEKIKKLKETDQPLSVIAPSKEWITQNCEIPDFAQEWLRRLPGPLTLILKLKKDSLATLINQGNDNVGVRMPLHWLQNYLKTLNTPIITTSVNRHDMPYMTSMANMDIEIAKAADFIIYEGRKQSKPSKIVKLVNNVEIIER